MRRKLFGIFLLIVILSSCGGDIPSASDVQLLIEKFAVTNSVEDAAEDGVNIAMSESYVVFTQYIQYYDSWTTPIQISRNDFPSMMGLGGTLDYSAELTYEKVSDGVYQVNVDIISVYYHAYGVPAKVGSTTQYINSVTNTTPFSASLSGTINMVSGAVDISSSGVGENYTVEGEVPGSVSHFNFSSTVGGTTSSLTYACTASSQMTLTLSSGETLTCIMSEDCQRCN